MFVVAIIAIALSGRQALAEKRVALVIGNSAYAAATALPGSTGDATAIAELLRTSGFDSVDLRLDVDNATFKAAVRKFDDASTSADIAVIFYAGYGIDVRGQNYLIPVDARLASHAVTEAVLLDRLISATAGAKKLRVVMLDASRDNPFVARMRADGASDMRAGASGLGKSEPATSGILVAYAAKAGTTSVDGGGEHSPFATALLNSLTTPGLDIRLAFGRVRDEVLKVTAGRQEPFVYGALDGGTYALVPASDPALPADGADARNDFELVQRIGTRKAYEVFLGTYKTGFYADIARSYLDRLGKNQPSDGPPGQRYTEPNWGDGIFIERLMRDRK